MPKSCLIVSRVSPEVGINACYSYTYSCILAAYMNLSQAIGIETIRCISIVAPIFSNAMNSRPMLRQRISSVQYVVV